MRRRSHHPVPGTPWLSPISCWVIDLAEVKGTETSIWDLKRRLGYQPGHQQRSEARRRNDEEKPPPCPWNPLAVSYLLLSSSFSRSNRNIDINMRVKARLPAWPPVACRRSRIAGADQAKVDFSASTLLNEGPNGMRYSFTSWTRPAVVSSEIKVLMHLSFTYTKWAPFQI